jgi:hypothetical protein
LGHTLPHVPQFELSVLVLTHCPLQHVSPPAQGQTLQSLGA